MKNIEVWKDIEGYEGHYQVSNQGRVRSLKFEKKRILKPHRDKGGYLLVNLCNNSEMKTFKVHRLVAKVFISNPQNLPEINHKDEIKTNNCVENLEWCDRKYNINYGTHIQRRSDKRSKPVIQYSKYGEFIKEWKSAIEIQIQFGYYHSNISRCCNGKRKSAYGFVWRYK